MLERCWYWGRRAAEKLAPRSTYLEGGLSGVLLVLWWTHLLTAFGGSLAVLTGLIVAAALGWAWGWRSRVSGGPDSSRGRRLVLLAVWTVLMPVLASGALASLWLVPISIITQPWAELVFALAAGGLMLAGPHYAVARSLPLWESDRYGSRPSVTFIWLALATAIFTVPTWIVPAIGLPVIGIASVATSLAWGLTLLLRTPPESNSAALARSSPAVRIEKGVHLDLFDLLPALAAGGLVALAGQVIQQLWANGLATVFASVAGLIAGLSLTGRSKRLSGAAAWTGLAAACSAVLLLGLFPVWIDVILTINSHVASPAWLLGWQNLLAFGLTIPAGIVLGSVLRGQPASTDRPRSSVLMIVAVLGWAMTRWTSPAPVITAAAIIACGLISAAASWWNSGRRLPRRLGWIALAAAAVVCGTSPWTLPNFAPGESARLLFSGRVALASQSTSQDELLTALDESRLMNVAVGRESVWTQWKQRGEQLVLRENGLPQGQLSLDLSIAPESGAELLAGTLPLCVHPRAEHVLVVGLGSGGTIRSGLEHPIQSLTCWEPDADLITLVQNTIRGPQAMLLDDPRFTVTHCNPVLASATKPGQRYDVIILNERQMAAWRTLGQRPVEAYRRWRTLLGPEGLLCQRLEFVDLGTEPLFERIRTLSAVFPQVVIWESAPGEVLLLASPREETLFDDQLAARFETPQARRLLARVGWDCSLPLGLATVSGRDLLEIAPTQGRVSTIANAASDYSVTWEMSRHTPKSNELLQLLGRVAREALTRLPDNEVRKSMQQRLTDVSEQQQLISRFPDHYWAYRKSLRERLQNRPRSVIVQMKHEQHPEDERRQEYLEALGAAATAKSPDAAALQAVAEFAAPFDPLVSPFLDREIAQLHARLDPPQPASELQHWLHAVYYSPGHDRSIRDATAALGILLQHPETMTDPARRWDHVNALLEVLKERWTLRSQQATLSRFEAADVGETMDVADRAIAYLQTESTAAGIDAEWAESRCRVLDRTFIRALRSYHAKQVARQEQLDRQRTALEQAPAVPR